MRKKINSKKKIDSSVLLEHFIGGMVSMKPIMLGGFPSRNALNEVEGRYDDTLKIQTEKSVVNSIMDPTWKKVGGKEVPYAPSFDLEFFTFINFPIEILQGIRENYNEKNPNWDSDDSLAIKKSLRVNEPIIKREIQKLQATGLIPPGYFIGIGESSKNAMPGIITYPRMMADIIDGVMNFVEENKVNKPLCYNYSIFVSIGAEESIILKNYGEYKEAATKFSSALDSLLLQDKTYYTFSKEKTPGSIFKAINKPSVGSDVSSKSASVMSIPSKIGGDDIYTGYETE